MRLPILLLLFSLVASCTFVQKIKDGDTAFERKQYQLAIGLLEKEYAKEKSRVEKGKKAFKIAESYKLIGKESLGLDWYQRAYDNSFGTDALKGYAYSLKTLQRYKDAGTAFKNLSMEIGSPYEYRREIQICEEADQWLSDAENSGITVSNLPINSIGSDYAPVLLDDDQLMFTSDRGGVGEATYGWTGKRFSDFFVADLNSYEVNMFQEVNINTPDNEGSSTFSKAKNSIIFTRCSHPEKYTDNYCRLFESKREGDSWTEAVPLNFTQPEVNYMHPTLSEDGSTLYFAADHDEGWGGFDIYFAERTPEGWSEPQLLGRTVNSQGNEKFPFIDGDKLYFASDYHPGLGGLDIFVSKKTGLSSWTKAENMKAPINSGKDDFGLIIAPMDGPEGDLIAKGYFGSNRKGGAGADDIFAFEQREVEVVEEEEPIDSTAIVEIDYKIMLSGYVVEKIYEIENNPNSRVLGRRPISGANVGITPSQLGLQITTNESGFFQLELNEDQAYSFLASKSGYLNNSASFNTKGIGKDPDNPVANFEIEIVLDKIFKNVEITLSNIYYDFDESFIRDDAKPTLNKLAETLQRNPAISIQLSSHTDCQGNSGYNETLSQQRAQAAVDYLIALGIESSRLSAVGYGENLPALDCLCNRCTDDEHQANRRTTFKVLE